MKHLVAAGMLTLLVAASAAAGDKPAGKKPGGPGGAGGKGGPGNGQMLTKLFERADANGDGKVSLAEFKKAAEAAPGGKLKDHAEQMFKRLDANSDGYVTKQEMEKAQQQMASRGAGAGKGGKKKPDNQ